jgi:hypothetical protein
MSKNPGVGRGSHFVLDEPGPYLFPDLIKHEQIDHVGYLLVLRLINAGKQRLWIPLSHRVARALLAAPEKLVPFESPTGIRPLLTVGMASPIEMPLLSEFVCFRAISPEWRLCELTNENGQRLLVSFSTGAYRAVIKDLKRILARKSIPAAAFAGRKVHMVQNAPRYERKLTIEERARGLAYHSGIEPEKYLYVWRKLAECRGLTGEEERAVAERLWAELGIDPRKTLARSKAAIEKFNRRLAPGGKVTFSSMRQCVACKGYFGTENGKREVCSDACSAALAEKQRPEGYHADFQRQCRAEIRAKARRKTIPIVYRQCKWCGNKHARRSLFCSLRCQKRYSAVCETSALAAPIHST